MPQPANLEGIEVNPSGGYFPEAKLLRPGIFQNTIRAGDGVWLRPGGVVEPAKGLSQVSSTNVGARIFAADIQRASIAGGLVGSRLPYAGLIRYDNAVLLYLSENTSAQVYLDEVAVTDLTASSTAGRLRVAVPDGGGGYDVFDAGFDKPVLQAADVTFFTGGVGVQGQKPMAGSIGVAIAPWRSKTLAVGPASEVVYQDIPPTGSSFIRIDPPSAVSGQDGWVFAGTAWNDQSGEIRVVRYVYLTPRGTFTATNGSDAITLGVGTFWNQDLRAHDLVVIDGGAYEIEDITGDGTATLTSNFTGSTGAGKTMTINAMAANWYNRELRGVVSRDVIRPPRAAGILKYGDRVFIWGIPDTNSVASTEATGNALTAMLDTNPEHVGPNFYIATASGSNLVNVLGGEGVLYLMTTTSLEVVELSGGLDRPYTPRIAAEPGFKASTNGVIHVDYFYGFNEAPFRTRAKENIDTQFAIPVLDDMKDWDATRVMLAVDPKKSAVLFIYDNATTTTVRPWMASQGVWGPPLNFSARIIDTQVVNGTLYVTYLSGGNYRVNAWEGGTFIGGTPYECSQYYDAALLSRSRLKRLQLTGKAATLRVYAALPGAPVPDVTDSGAAAASFTLSDIADQSEPEIFTNLEGRAFAFRTEFSDEDGRLESLIARGTGKSELR